MQNFNSELINDYSSPNVRKKGPEGALIIKIIRQSPVSYILNIVALKGFSHFLTIYDIFRGFFNNPFDISELDILS